MPGLASGIEAVLFDVDGTLIDTHRLYLEAYRRALRPFLGYPPDDAEIIARRPSSERRFLVGWIGAERADECHALLCRHYAELHRALGEGMYEGVPEMLRGLRSAGIPLGVVTGKGRRAWEVTGREVELGEFAVVVTDDEVERPKPHPEGLLRAAEALGASPARTVYIGDSVGDVEAARQAGMLAGAALWPKTAPGEADRFLEALRPLAPEWRFARPAEVTRTFAAWC